MSKLRFWASQTKKRKTKCHSCKLVTVYTKEDLLFQPHWCEEEQEDDSYYYILCSNHKCGRRIFAWALKGLTREDWDVGL